MNALFISLLNPKLFMCYSLNNIQIYVSFLFMHLTVYFTRLKSGYVPEHVDKVVTVPQSPSQCAATCFSNTDFICNSFYVCTSSNQCLLSIQHVPDGANQEHTTCISYSSKFVEMSESVPAIKYN
jgi:uncharacterized membrane protein